MMFMSGSQVPTNWREQLAAALGAVEDQVDAVRRGIMTAAGVRKALTITPYIGHVTADQLYLRGRVLLDNAIIPATPADSLWRNISNTVKRFESDEIPGAVVRAVIGDHEQVVTADAEGFFQISMALDDDSLRRDQFWQNVHLSIVETPIPTLDHESTHAVGKVIVPPDDAQFGVISDLDDTIVRTDVLNVFKMMRNTMLRNAHTRLPFAGVPAFYRALQRGTTDTHNPIFYVSSSPWNLYDLIIDFYTIREIPLGPVYLRHLGISRQNLRAKGHMEHKLHIIQKLLDRYPHLPFVLIGDSGQKDARVYLEVVRRNPGRIPAIYIRNVTDQHRARVIHEIAAQVRQLESELLLVRDTAAAAAHAAERGLIPPEVVPTIQQECR